MHSAGTGFTSHEKMTRFGELFAELEGKHDDDLFFDGEDNMFGTPEEQARQKAATVTTTGGTTTRKSSVRTPCETVMDACLACDENALCDLLRKGVTKGVLNKKHPKTGRVSFIQPGTPFS